MNDNKDINSNRIIGILSLIATVFFGLRTEGLLRFEEWDYNKMGFVLSLIVLISSVLIIIQTRRVKEKVWKAYEEYETRNNDREDDREAKVEAERKAKEETKRFNSIIRLTAIVLVFAIVIIGVFMMCSGNRENFKENIETPETQELVNQEIDSTKMMKNNKLFNVVNISVLDSTTSFVKFQYVGSNKVGSIAVSLGETGIYSLGNSFDFPIWDLRKGDSFEIKLYHRKINDNCSVRVSIEWYDKITQQRYRELKDIDIVERKVYEVDCDVKTTKDMEVTIIGK